MLLRDVIGVPELSEDQVKLCDLTEKDLYKSLKNMQNDKSLGNDGLTKEVYETFGDKLKEMFESSSLSQVPRVPNFLEIRWASQM